MRIHIKLIAAIVGMLMSALSLAAQSTNPSGPTPVNGEYAGKGPSAETNYYFNFTGGPREVSVTLEIKGKDYSTFARMEIGNDPSNLIAMHNMNASTTTGVSSATKEFKLSKKQTIRIKLTLDQNLAEYKLMVSGGVGGSFQDSGPAQSSDTSASSSKTGKIGQMTANSVGKLSATGKQGKGVDSDSGKQTQNFSPPRCPAEIMYKTVPESPWSPGLSSQKRYLFQEAGVVGKQLWCTYTQVGSSNDSATISHDIPVGFSCQVYKGGSKSRDFVCGDGILPESGQ